MEQTDKPAAMQMSLTESEAESPAAEVPPAESGREPLAVGETLFHRPFLWIGLLCAGLLLALAAAFPLWGTWPQMPVTEYFADMTEGEKLDLNTADLAALCTLPGIGAAKAQAILDWRQKNGGFSSPEQLLQVEGIGEKLFDGMKERICVGTE